MQKIDLLEDPVQGAIFLLARIIVSKSIPRRGQIQHRRVTPDDTDRKPSRSLKRSNFGRQEFVPFRDGETFYREIVGFHPTLLNLSPSATRSKVSRSIQTV